MCFVCVLCSILGMHLFGCKFGLRQESGDTLPDRKNFDSLLWATVTVFQVRWTQKINPANSWEYRFTLAHTINAIRSFSLGVLITAKTNEKKHFDLLQKQRKVDLTLE